MAEKTEAPTQRKKEEAKNKGQGVGRSAELSMGLTLGVGLLMLSSLVPGVASRLVTEMQSAIVNMSPHASNAQLLNETGGVMVTVLTLILPLACMVMVAGVAGQLVAGGLVLSPKAVRFDISRVNPLSGLKRMADKQALVRLGLASAKLAILAVVSWEVVASRVPAIVNSQGSSATVIAGTCLAAIFQLGLTITILLAVVALTDFVVQRRKAQQSLRMSKQEVKQEYKEQEGDPLVRGARRRRARQMAFARMMDAVPTSDVIVTNPTTLAVALKYDSLTMKAPKIVAKGQRLMAERIKAIAREHNVPIIEDKPLARALFPRPIGSEVQAHLYRAVARLLVLVHQTRFGAGARGGRRGSENRASGQARTAPGGFAGRPWWSSAGSSGLPSMLGGSMREAMPLEAVALEPGAVAGAEDATPADDWLDEAALTAEDVDEEALAVAMAEDELGDMTNDELAQLEAGLVLGEDSDDPDDEENVK
jgi:flagellar biosynthetic protein FlhB